jgi:hypothetical protein
MSERLRRLWNSSQRPGVLRAAGLLGVVLVLGAALVGMDWLRLARRAQALDSEQAALAAAEVEAEARHVLIGELAVREARVRALRARGFTAEADRVAWVEAVTGAVEALRPLRYKVEAGAEVALPLPPSVQAWYDERGLAAPRLVANELRLELEGLHEDELGTLVTRAREAGGGVVRIERCRIERRPGGEALASNCVLRRFALLAPRALESTT